MTDTLAAPCVPENGRHNCSRRACWPVGGAGRQEWVSAETDAEWEGSCQSKTFEVTNPEDEVTNPSCAFNPQQGSRTVEHYGIMWGQKCYPRTLVCGAGGDCQSGQPSVKVDMIYKKKTVSGQKKWVICTREPMDVRIRDNNIVPYRLVVLKGSSTEYRRLPPPPKKKRREILFLWDKIWIAQEKCCFLESTDNFQFNALLIS